MELNDDIQVDFSRQSFLPIPWAAQHTLNVSTYGSEPLLNTLIV